MDKHISISHRGINPLVIMLRNIIVFLVLVEKYIMNHDDYNDAYAACIKKCASTNSTCMSKFCFPLFQHNPMFM